MSLYNIGDTLHALDSSDHPFQGEILSCWRKKSDGIHRYFIRWTYHDGTYREFNYHEPWVIDCANRMTLKRVQLEILDEDLFKI
jgi:hypothetical protein